MRPRPEGRGERLRPAAREESAFGRFNAATTRRPWRTPVGRSWPTNWFSCFNAATTRRPWRTRARIRPWRATHCFNAATTRRPWRTPGPWQPSSNRTRLQCGHDPKAVENTMAGETRERTWDGFNAATTRRPWRTDGRGRELSASDASMRPRPEGRGERRSWPKPARGSGSFNAATTRRPWRTSTAAGCCRECRLQCGHDPKAVENAGRLATWPARTRRLQCGHDPKAVENAAAAMADDRGRASMRPRPEGRGERRR